jgi:fibro-slime domain-containing protein
MGVPSQYRFLAGALVLAAGLCTSVASAGRPVDTAATSATNTLARSSLDPAMGTFDSGRGTFTISLDDYIAWASGRNSSNVVPEPGTSNNHTASNQDHQNIWIIDHDDDDNDDDDDTNLNDLLPETVQLTGTVYDFQSRHVSGGHPDFQRQPTGGFAHYTGMAQDQLDSEFKPVFASTGYKVTTQWRDAAGNNIIGPKPYISTRGGDINGARQTTEGGALTTANAFGQWYRNVNDVNLSTNIALTLRKQPNSNIYVFDDTLDPNFASRGGFFPIDSTLFGLSGEDCSGRPHNFHFTFELPTGFVYKEGTNQTFTFRGDDDVWVYIDGKLVIDLGGVHGPFSQTISLDRLGWLEDGQSYDLRFFFAERNTCGSNFRIETSIVLRMIGTPPVTSLAD